MQNGRNDAVAFVAALLGDVVDGRAPERHHVEVAVDAIIEAAVLTVQARLAQGSEHAQAVAALLRPPIDLTELDRALEGAPTVPAGGQVQKFIDRDDMPTDGRS
jgi:hypothetical protein